jgi:hypothetical protein
MSEVTRILSAIEQGDPHAAEQLLPLVYDELRPISDPPSDESFSRLRSRHKPFGRSGLFSTVRGVSRRMTGSAKGIRRSPHQEVAQ